MPPRPPPYAATNRSPAAATQGLLEAHLDARAGAWTDDGVRADTLAALLRGGVTAGRLAAGVAESDLAALGVRLGPRRALAAAGFEGMVRAAGSQYTGGGVSACTPMAVEACLQLLEAASLDDDASLRAVMRQALVEGRYLGQAHLAPDEVLAQPRYRGRLFADPRLPPLLCGGDAHAAAAQQVPLAALGAFLGRLGELVAQPPQRLAVVLVKPPETVAVAALARKGRGPAFAVFDSHPRPGEPSAAIAVFGSAAAVAQHLRERVWPLDPAALDGIDAEQARQMTTVDFTPLTLAAAAATPSPAAAGTPRPLAAAAAGPTAVPALFLLLSGDALERFHDDRAGVIHPRHELDDEVRRAAHRDWLWGVDAIAAAACAGRGPGVAGAGGG